MASINLRFKKRKEIYVAQVRFMGSNRTESYYIYPKIKIPLEFFDSKNKQLKKRSPKYFELSQDIKDLESRILKFEEEIMFKENISSSEMKALFVSSLTINAYQKLSNENIGNSLLFFAFSEKLQNELKSLGKNGNAQAYYYATMKLRKFHIYDLTIDEITYSLLIDFKNHYLIQGEKLNTISTHLSKLRAIYNEACNRLDYSPTVHPFKKGLIVYQQTKKKNLGSELLVELKELDLKGTQERVRDLFLLSFYLRGLDLVDILTIDSNINGNYISVKRKKLGDKDSGYLKIKIEPEAEEIIDKYKQPDTVYLLPFYKKEINTEVGWKNYNTVANNLRRAKNNLLKQHELDIDLTFKSIRHSWASIARQCNLPYDVIQTCLGHKNADVTDIYIEYDQKQLDDANRTVIEFVFERDYP